MVCRASEFVAAPPLPGASHPPLGFEKPSAIQQRAIVPIIKGRDVIAQSQSGTGKTGVFCIGVLGSIDNTVMETQAIVLSPTRELAEQTEKVMLSIGEYLKVQCHACIGGRKISDDIKRLDYGVQVVSGPPGGFLDMLHRNHLRTRNIKVLVIDEADEMLNEGFIDQIHEVYRYLPQGVQV